MLALIRHGATMGNLKRQYVGKTDEGLCAEGTESLRSMKVPQAERVFTSPMRRCLESARILYPEIIPTTIDDLSERNFGAFEGKTYEDLKDVPEYRAWIDSEGFSPIPGGESRECFDARCVNGFLSIFNEANRQQNIAVITHGGAIMSILCALNESKASYYDYQIKNGHGFLCEWTNNHRLKILGRIGE